MITCKNCNHQFEGNFCPNCGQRTTVDKITWTNFIKEVTHSVFQIDRGFFHTMIALFTEPGESIKGYLTGKRKYHFKPIAYVLTLSTIYFLISRSLEEATFINDAVTGFASGVSKTNRGAEHLPLLRWFADNYAYTILLLLPFSTLASYLSFLKSGYNYLEHFVLNSYLTGQLAVFYIVFTLLSLIGIHEDILILAMTFISVIYTFWVFWQFFDGYSRLSIILRFILTYLLYLFMLTAVLIVLFEFSDII